MIHLYWLNIIIDFSFNFIMMNYSSTQFTLRFKFRTFSHSFLVHNFLSRFHIIRTYLIIWFFFFKSSTIHDFTSTIIRFIFINFSTIFSILNIVRNIFDIDNFRIFKKIHNFNTKNSSLNESKAKENFNKNDSN